MATHLPMLCACLSSLRAQRPLRLRHPKPTTIKPADSRHERGATGGEGQYLQRVLPFPWPRAAPTVCRTDLRLLAFSIHALRKTFPTFRRCICKRPPTGTVKMGDNEDLTCDGGNRSAFSGCAIQGHLVAVYACAASVSCFSEPLLWSWPCRLGWRGWRLRLPSIHRIVCRRRNKQMLGIRRLIIRTVMTVIATSQWKLRMSPPRIASLTFVPLF